MIKLFTLVSHELPHQPVPKVTITLLLWVVVRRQMQMLRELYLTLLFSIRLNLYPALLQKVIKRLN